MSDDYIPSEEALDAADDSIPNQSAVEAVVVEQIDARFGEPGDAIADLTAAVALNSTFSDTEVEAAFLATNNKVNAILAALRTANIIETA